MRDELVLRRWQRGYRRREGERAAAAGPPDEGQSEWGRAIRDGHLERWREEGRAREAEALRLRRSARGDAEAAADRGSARRAGGAAGGSVRARAALVAAARAEFYPVGRRAVREGVRVAGVWGSARARGMAGQGVAPARSVPLGFSTRYPTGSRYPERRV